MASQPCQCFDEHRKGHFYSADTLLENGVWIGYLADKLRGMRYRNMPSFRELENNHRNLRSPYPTPLPGSSCSDREAVCRGCFGDGSSILQLRETRFGPHNKVVVMPLDRGMCCIMLPQPQGRSNKTLETFRPFEHQMGRDDERPFANNYRLLAIRDRTDSSGVLNTVRLALDSVELSLKTDCPAIPQTETGPDEPVVSELTKENLQPPRGQRSIKKRTRHQPVMKNPGSRIVANENRPETLNTRRHRARVTRLSESSDHNDKEDSDEPLLSRQTCISSSGARVQQYTPVSPGNFPKEPSSQIPVPEQKKVTNIVLEDEQAQRIHFVWKIEFEGMEHEVRRTLSSTSTFLGLLESFREEAEVIPSASRQMRESVWTVRYRLADGTGKAVLIKPSSQHCELSFDGLLRSLIENDAWKDGSEDIVEIELKAVLTEASI